MLLRAYDPQRDRDAAQRIYREVGWIDESKEQAEAMDLFLGAGRSLVAELAGLAECSVTTVRAVYRYLDEDLPLCAVTNVVTGHAGRRRGLASRLTAAALAHAAGEGSLVAALGAFEQGYYDRLGFGNGAYDHWLSFDPALLKVQVPHRVPQRITAADWAEVHAARLAQPRRHGAVTIGPAALTRAEMLCTKSPVGLGYRDGPGGALSHCIWGGAGGMEHGPYYIRWLACRTRQEFLELMALVKSLGDQVRLVGLMEPPGMQLEDLLAQPFKQRQITSKSPHEAVARAVAWWQVRMLDLAGCLACTHLAGPAVRFNLRLSDPAERFLPPEATWRGLAGEYVVSLGPESAAAPGCDPALPTLSATVNAFSRMWIGVQPASGLAVTDELAGPPELLATLDAALRLPRPSPGWDF